MNVYGQATSGPGCARVRSGAWLPDNGLEY